MTLVIAYLLLHEMSAHWLAYVGVTSIWAIRQAVNVGCAIIVGRN